MLGFRVWESAQSKMLSDEMLQPFFLDSNGIVCGQCLEPGSGTVAIFPLSGSTYIPMQSTGQLDINGKMIYEGDFIHVPDDILLYVRSVKDFYIKMCRLGNPTGFEIIGNKYSNPELLEKIK